MGYPGGPGSHLIRGICCDGDNLGVDPVVLVIILAVGMPVAVVGGLAYSARLRGPAPRTESKRRVGSLVTEAVPEARADEADDRDDGPTYSIDSPPPDPDPGLRERSDS